MSRRSALFPVRRVPADDDIPARFREARTGLPPWWKPSLRQLRRWQRQADEVTDWLLSSQPENRWDGDRRWRWYHWITHPVQGWRNWRRFH